MIPEREAAIRAGSALAVAVLFGQRAAAENSNTLDRELLDTMAESGNATICLVEPQLLNPNFGRPLGMLQEGRALFDPDQPRDDQGQWAPAGGGGSAESAPAGEQDFGELVARDDTDEAMRIREKHERYIDNFEEAEGEANHEYAGYSEALDYYTGDGYSDMNAMMRRDPTGWDDNYEEYPDEDEGDRRFRRGDETVRHAVKLGEAIDNAPKLREPVTVYRGVMGDFEGKVGDTLTMHGFQSAAFEPENVVQFMRGESGYILRIAARRGLSLGEHSRSTDGSEFIMNHRTKFRVKGAGRGRIGDRVVRVFDVEQVER